MIFFVFVTQLLVGNIECTFQGGFEKGLKDFQSGTYGADPDRFCYADSQNQRSAFIEAYELGRDHSYLFSKVGMTTVPKDQGEFREILKEVRSLKIQLESTKNQASGPKPDEKGLPIPTETSNPETPSKNN